jgi:putative spermidine/putrescine transport system substrate-binding protein
LYYVTRRFKSTVARGGRASGFAKATSRHEEEIQVQRHTEGHRARLALALAIPITLLACTGSPTATPATSARPSTSAQASTPAQASASASATSAPTSGASGSGGTLAVEGGTGQYGDCLQSQWYTPYTQATGTTIQVAPEGDGSLTVEQLAVQTKNYQVDVNFAGTPGDVESQGPNILEPVDYSVVNKDQLYDGFAFTYGVGGPPNGFVFGYNADALNGKTPTKLEDFFDTTNFPGKRGILQFMEPDIIALALIASGVDPAHVTPFDYDKAFGELDKIKDSIVWAQSGTQARQLLEAKEAPMELTFSSRIKESVDAGTNAKVVWDGFSVFFDTWVVPKGDPKAADAMKLIAYISSAEHNAAMSQCVAVGVSNKQATGNPAVSDYVVSSHYDARHVILSDSANLQWMEANASDIHDKFQAWKTQ